MNSKLTLLIDLGNTRLKWVLRGNVPWRMEAALLKGYEPKSVLSEMWRALPAPASVVMVSVAEQALTDIVRAWIEQRWRVPMHTVAAEAELLGVRNSYRMPQRLGADRWAALIGARGETTASVCVVDCGTAVTIDALTADGEFAGGVIFPGLSLLRAALTRGTAGIREADGNETSCLARATADAVAAGTAFGLVGAIERVAHEFDEMLGESMELIITGGDADRVVAMLMRPAQRVPDLVLKGLARIATTLE